MEGGMKEEALTEKLIGVFYTVYNDLGHGFLEKIYSEGFCPTTLKTRVQF